MIEKLSNNQFRESRTVFENYDLTALEAQLVILQANLATDQAQEIRMRQIERQIQNKTDCTDDERMKMIGTLAFGRSGTTNREINRLQNLIDSLKAL